MASKDDKISRALTVDKALYAREHQGSSRFQKSPTRNYSDSLRGQYRDWDDGPSRGKQYSKRSRTGRAKKRGRSRSRMPYRAISGRSMA